jgi:acetyl-CoA acetyltransferase
VNSHPWLPGAVTPYVVAIVAIEEDPRVRLTVNIRDCDPEHLVVGTRVSVVFENYDDVWLPQFVPVPDAPPGTIADDDPPTPYIRPRVGDRQFEHDVAITGVGASEIGRRLMRDPVSLAVDAATRAVQDAGLDWSDIDGLSTYPGPWGLDGGHSEGGIEPLEEALRLRPTWINGGMDMPGQSGAVVAAMLAVSSGLCRHVLCVRTVWESTAASFTRTPDAPRRSQGTYAAWRHPYGAISPATHIALFASNYLARHDVGREALGWIAITERAHAALNPDAIYRAPISMDDYLEARMISSPFGLYDCDVPCDGSIAVVVSAKEIAADLRQPPVLVDAVGTQVTERLSWDQSTLGHEPQVNGPAAHLWSRSHLRPADVDVALLYDGFTFNALSWLEALGFCGFGEAPDFVAGGIRIGLGGELPLNTHGGQLSAGRTHGFGFVYEAVQQLRNQAGARQVSGAEVAVVTTGGGIPGGALLLTTAR